MDGIGKIWTGIWLGKMHSIPRLVSCHCHYKRSTSNIFVKLNVTVYKGLLDNSTGPMVAMTSSIDMNQNNVSKTRNYNIG